MEDVVSNLLESLRREGITRAGAVKEIVLRIGALDIHSEQSFKQAYEILVKGTLLEGSQLQLEIIPATYKCQACGYEGTVGVGEADGHQVEPVIECSRCGQPCVVIGGRGMHAIDLVVED